MQASISEFKTEITCEKTDEVYDICLGYKDCQFLFKLSKDLEYWETSFEFGSLQSENKFLSFIEKDQDFFDFIVVCFSEKHVSLSKINNNDMKITFSFLIVKMKKEISFELKYKKPDVSEAMNQIINHISKSDQQVKEMQKNFENKFTEQFNYVNNKLQSIEEKMDDKLQKMMDFFQELKKEIKEMKKLIEEEKMTKMIVSYDFSFFAGNNNGDFSLSNSNKTLKCNSDGWFGFRCDPPKKLYAKMSFSIRIDNVDKNSHIMVGWCVKNANYLSGFYSTNSSFCMYLCNGLFYYRYKHSTYVSQYVKGKIGEIYSAIIYVREKKIGFCLNGVSLCEPLTIDIKNEEINLLCPFVDLYSSEDQVSIVEFKDFNENALI